MENKKKISRWLDYVWRIALLLVGTFLLLSFFIVSFDGEWEYTNLILLVFGGLCMVPFFVKKRNKKSPQKKQKEKTGLMGLVDSCRQNRSAGNEAQPEEVKIYSYGHKKASKDAKWSKKLEVRLVNILVVIGASLWFVIDLVSKAGHFKVGIIMAIFMFAAFVYLVVKFIEERREHEITFDKNGVSIKEPKSFSKSYNQTTYQWESIAYVVKGKRLQKGNFLFLNKAKKMLFTINGDTYDFSEKDIAAGLAIAPSEVMEITYKEYMKAL